jgi:hypothetical protein
MLPSELVKEDIMDKALFFAEDVWDQHVLKQLRIDLVKIVN